MTAGQPLQEGSFWDRVLDMFAQSIIVQSLITALLITTLCFMWIYSTLTGGGAVVQIPQELLQLTMIVLGFWFGQKTQVTGNRQAEDIAMKISNAQASALAVERQRVKDNEC